MISKGYANNKISYVKNKIKQAVFISIGIGILVTTVFMVKPDFLLKFVYNTTEGTEYIKLLAPFFLIYHIQVPLTAALQAINKAKEAMIGTLLGMIVKLPLILLLSTFKIGLYSLAIALIVNIIIVTVHNYKHIKKALATK